MKKIIQVNADTIVVQDTMGATDEFKIGVCAFTPSVGDEVEVIKTLGGDIFIAQYKNQASVNLPVTQSQPLDYSHQNNTHTICDISLVSEHTVSQGVYVLLALLLGTFGVHKFYAGRVGLGVVYLILGITLILAFIPAFIAFIEAIIAATKQPDCFGKIEA